MSGCRCLLTVYEIIASFFVASSCDVFKITPLTLSSSVLIYIPVHICVCLPCLLPDVNGKRLSRFLMNFCRQDQGPICQEVEGLTFRTPVDLSSWGPCYPPPQFKLLSVVASLNIQFALILFKLHEL